MKIIIIIIIIIIIMLKLLINTLDQCNECWVQYDQSLQERR